jgi:SAM-dependent methyltransferase
MRDVVTGFYEATLTTLMKSGDISISDRVLVVCGGPLDQKVMASVGFSDFTVTSLTGDRPQSAENLTYESGSFDTVIVHAGLHHCYSPHRALLEMYRVPRKEVIAFESRDSLLMRTAVHLGLTEQYEVSSVTVDGQGGVAESGIPNFVYRWTERDVMKAIASYDPTRAPSIKFFYDFRVPIYRFSISGRPLMHVIGVLLEPLSRIFAKLIPKQCNEFAFAISKDGGLHPWINR